MYTFDAHIDTLMKLVVPENAKKDLNSLEQSHVTVDKMVLGGINAQIFAVFVEPMFLHGMALHRALQMIDAFWVNLAKFSEKLGPVLTGKDLEVHHKADRIACLLSLEGGEALQGDMANLRNLYRLGVRAMTLTWNFRNEIASGASESKGGLSEFGKDVVAEMNHLGMLVDVSHLNEDGFWDVITHSKNPVIASHSNAKMLRNHVRNLTDQQIRALADKGGVIGMNFCPHFLVDSGQATIHHIIEQVQYMIKVGGAECVGLGSDYDGIESAPVGLEDVSKIARVAEELKKAGVEPTVIEKVMGLNFLRVAKDVLGA